MSVQRSENENELRSNFIRNHEIPRRIMRSPIALIALTLNNEVYIRVVNDHLNRRHRPLNTFSHDTTIFTTRNIYRFVIENISRLLYRV